MAGETTLGYMAYRLTLDKAQFDRGVKVAKDDLRGLGKEGDNTDIQIKRLSKDVSTFGSSLASMGGLAIGAGLALGDDGLGKGLTTAGMGMSIVGGIVATTLPGLRMMAVVLEGTLVPALMKTAAAAWLALGPLGLLAGAVAAVAASYLILKAIDTSQHFSVEKKSIDDVYDSIKLLNKEYETYLDIQKQIAGIPEERAELETGKRAAELDLEDIRRQMEEFGPDLYEKRQTLGLAAITAGETLKKAETPLAKATAQMSLDQALQAVAENEKAIEAFEEGRNTDYNRILNREQQATNTLSKYTRKLAELPEKEAELRKEEGKISAERGLQYAALTGGGLAIPEPKKTTTDMEEFAPDAMKKFWSGLDWMPGHGKATGFLKWLTPKTETLDMGVPGGTEFKSPRAAEKVTLSDEAFAAITAIQMRDLPMHAPVSGTTYEQKNEINITVSTADEAVKVATDFIQGFPDSRLNARLAQKGM